MKRLIKNIVFAIVIAGLLIGEITPKVYAQEMVPQDQMQKIEVRVDGILYVLHYLDLGNFTIEDTSTGNSVSVRYSEQIGGAIVREVYNGDVKISSSKSQSELNPSWKPQYKIRKASSKQIYDDKKKVTCQWKTKNGNQYWYNISTSTPKYVRIGCVATYERKYRTYQSNLDKYIGAVNSCNSHCSTANAILGMTNAGLLMFDIAVIAAGAVIAPATLVAVLCATGGTSTTAIVALGNAYNQYLTVKSTYQLLT